MASLESFALHSTLFVAENETIMGDEKKYDDDTTTVGSSSLLLHDDAASLVENGGGDDVSLGEAAGSVDEATKATTATVKPRSRLLLQQRRNKHAMRRRFSSGSNTQQEFDNPTIEETTTTSRPSDTVSSATTTTTAAATTVSVSTHMTVDSEPETASEERRARRKIMTRQKRERMQKLNQQLRSSSVSKGRASPVVPEQQQQQITSMKEEQQSNNRTPGTETAMPPSPKPRSVSTPRERAQQQQRRNQLRSRSVTKARSTEERKAPPPSSPVQQPKESLKRPTTPRRSVGGKHAETQVPKFLQDKVAKMRQSDTFRRRLMSSSSSVSSVEMEGTKINRQQQSTSKDQAEQLLMPKQSLSTDQEDTSHADTRDNSFAAELAFIERQLMNPTNSSMAPKSNNNNDRNDHPTVADNLTADKKSIIARRNRIKQKHGFRMHATRTPSPAPGHNQEEEETTSKGAQKVPPVTKTENEMSTTTIATKPEISERRSESLSPIPRLTRLKQKVGHRPMHSRSPSPTLRKQDSEEPDGNTTNSQSIMKKRSESHSPVPRFSRRKQLTNHRLRALTPSPTPSRGDEDASLSRTDTFESEKMPETKVSNSPLPRLDRLKQKNSYAYFKSPASPAKSLTTSNNTNQIEDASLSTATLAKEPPTCSMEEPKDGSLPTETIDPE